MDRNETKKTVPIVYEDLEVLEIVPRQRSEYKIPIEKPVQERLFN